MSKHMKRISRFQVRQGIYLDFEGFRDHPPALAGFLIDDRFQQVVFDPGLASAAEAMNIPLESFGSCVSRLLEDCEKNSRFIIAFSIHELVVIERELGKDISTRYKNALKFAKRWKTEHLQNTEMQKKSLDEFLALTDVRYEVPCRLQKGQAAKWLRSVLSGLRNRGDYSKLTGNQKQSWQNLLEYNRHDVLGLHALVKRASQDMAR